MTTPDFAAQRALLDRLDAVERDRSVLFAREARLTAAMVELWGQDQGGVVLEAAGTARMGQVRTSTRLDNGSRLVRLFPTTLGLLELGVMRVATVEIVLQDSRNATEHVQRELDTRLAERICLLDAVDTHRLVTRMVLEVEAELDAAAQRERLERAKGRRGVWVLPGEDGMARIGADLDAISARHWSLHLEELVRAQKVQDDREGIARSQAQRRADVFAQLPAQVLALVDAAAKGRLDAVLQQAATGAGAVPAPRVSPEGPPPPQTQEHTAEQTQEQPAEQAHEHTAGQGAGQGELALDLPDRTAPLWWQRDREELLCALLRLPVRRPAVLVLHTAVSTQLDLDQRSGWLEGYGPVPALHARILQPVAALRRLGVDAHTGVPLGLDPLTGPAAPWGLELDPDPPHRPDPERHPRHGPEHGPERERARLLRLLTPMYLTDTAESQHDPSTALRELARIRDQACDGPGCARTASACELDHETPYADGGQTAIWNLKHRSTRCHLCKHHGWSVHHDHATAISTWTSPTGSTYVRHPLWQPPTELPDGIVLGAPRIEPPLRGDVDGPVDTYEHPLWPQPPTTSPSRYPDPDPDQLRADGTIAPKPKPRRYPDTRCTSWDDDPPLF